MFRNTYRFASKLQAPFVSKNIFRGYSSGGRKKEVIEVKYIFMTCIASTIALVLAANRLKTESNNKKTSFTEEEYAKLERQAYLKRRKMLIGPECSSFIKVYSIPFVHLNSTIEELAKHQKFSNSQVEIVDPQVLIEKEKSDESSKYGYLLQDLEKTNKPLPKGLITALIKNYFSDYLGKHTKQPTTFLLKNYPQDTDEAMKFENEVGNIEKCIVYHYDMINELPKSNVESQVQNVVGYFDTVGKAKTVTSKKDEMDSWLKEIILEDI